MRRSRYLAAVFGVVLLAGGGASAAPLPAQSWSAGWAVPDSAPQPALTDNGSAKGFRNDTIRQVIRVDAGGPQVRVRLSNRYGPTPLRLTGASIGYTGKAGALIDPRPLTFGGSRSTVVPEGAQLRSDPVAIPVRQLDSLTVNLYFAGATGPATNHPEARATSYRAKGDHTEDTGASAFTEHRTSWYFLDEVDVRTAGQRAAVVPFGDSITDGTNSTVDADNRYPDELAERLRAAGSTDTVLDSGVSGNRVLHDSPCFGERALARFGRDVLDRPGVRSTIILEGINDIGASAQPSECFLPNTRVTDRQLIAGYQRLIHAARARGITVLGATLLPYQGASYYSPQGELVRERVNDWIRHSGAYDAVVDFDRVMRDPAHPKKLNPAYDSGDALHPNDRGYRAMAGAIDLGKL
ncbi:SGNH/GDSL hydrolase family protein [Sciscionella sediminilitoris]|uniref:SGNH/GDSL hydrolase family protein n=1 Tax=Sciscionella sediminilitoris TaxID=1445613 RepID=UPI0004DF39B3|nr:SGNH/GDSL hydrolase family protein [Sciscionella sp. SE31]